MFISKKAKRIISSIIMANLLITSASTAVSAEFIETTSPVNLESENIARSMVSLPEGVYYCLSGSRTNSYIEIVNNNAGTRYDQTVYYYDVYSREAGGYVSGSGYHTYSLSYQFNFCINYWHITGSTKNNTTTLIIPTTYSGGDFILVNGEIYSRK